MSTRSPFVNLFIYIIHRIIVRDNEDIIINLEMLEKVCVCDEVVDRDMKFIVLPPNSKQFKKINT